jgi:MtN3 and saliva related transmembrane protein
MSKEFVISIASLLAIITTIVSFAPQAVKVYRTGSAKDICMITMLNSLLCSISWITYGVLIDNPTIWSPNIVLLISSAYIIYFKLANKS